MGLDKLLPPTPISEGTEPEQVSALNEPRLLTAEEVASLEPIFAGRNVPLPAPEHSYFIGTVDDLGMVTSFIVMQLRVHAEPMWIAPGNEHIFRHLIRVAEQSLAERVVGDVELYAFTPPGKVARLAEVAGMKAEPWVVYCKTVHGTAQPPAAPVSDSESAEQPASPTSTMPEPLDRDVNLSREVN